MEAASTNTDVKSAFFFFNLYIFFLVCTIQPHTSELKAFKCLQKKKGRSLVRRTARLLVLPSLPMKDTKGLCVLWHQP